MKLTSKARNKLPSSTFALPSERKFPISNPSHARNALARAANRSPGIKAKVRAKVKAKFPSIKIDGGKSQARLDRAPRH